MTNIVEIERREDIALVRFDRQARANALTFPLMAELTQVARSFEGDTRTAAIVLAGAPAIFSGGMDLRADVWEGLPELELEDRRQLAAHGPRLARAWMGLEQVTVAAIEGPCFAGGLALAAMCDFRVSGRSATFAAPEVAIGLNMAWHSVPRLVRLLGPQPTRRLLLLGETWDAPTAHDFGLLDHVVDDEAAVAQAVEIAHRVARRPVTAMRMVKRAIEATQHGGDVAWSGADGELQLVNWTSREFAAARAAIKTPRRKGQP